MFDHIKISDIPRCRREILRKPSNTRPALCVIEDNGVRAVVKDYSKNSLLYRNIVGRLLIWRERKAYRKLKGLNGIPSYYRSIDGLALLLDAGARAGLLIRSFGVLSS